jgi:hypothetical protein
MWCLLAALALLGVLVHLPEGAAVKLAVPERQIVVTRGAGLKSPQISVVNPDTLPPREGLDIKPSKDAADSGTAKAVSSVSLLFMGELAVYLIYIFRAYP